MTLTKLIFAVIVVDKVRAGLLESGAKEEEGL
jgi:hypothetical protein